MSSALYGTIDKDRCYYGDPLTAEEARSQAAACRAFAEAAAADLARLEKENERLSRELSAKRHEAQVLVQRRALVKDRQQRFEAAAAAAEHADVAPERKIE